MTTPFFPEPDILFSEEEREKFLLKNLKVFRMMTSETKEVGVACISDEDGKRTLFRFLLPRTSRAVRRFFRLAKEPRIPTVRDSFTLTQGEFLLDVEGETQGEDNLPENSGVERLYVLKNVRVHKTS